MIVRGSAAMRVLGATIAFVVAACSGTDGSPQPTQRPSAVATRSAAPSAAPTLPPTASPVAPFRAADFAGLRADPMPAELSARLERAFANLALGRGMTATVISRDGTWSGARGKADGVSDLVPESQFGIASVTKSVVAAQVMQLVEAGEIDLDVAADSYLPADLGFDTNGATIRQLLDMRSGIPDWYSDSIEQIMATDRGRTWTTADVLALVPGVRSSLGTFEYADTNYTLLGLAIEHVRQRPLVEVLRNGVLAVPGTDRLVYQPAEAPTGPMAMPRGEPASAFQQGGGYLPSISDASSAGPAGALASDSISLARWWQAFCAGEVVSEASLTEMATFVGGPDGYGLGLFNPVDPWATGIGHAGSNFGYVSWAGCLPDDHLVVVVLANSAVDDIGGMAEPLVSAFRAS